MSRQLSDRPRVFCIGWHKTGTSSLGHALIKLGYSVLGCRLDMVHPLRRGKLDTVLELAGRYDALQDVPWSALFRELDRAFPGSRFILTERQEDSWIRSALRHFTDTHIPLHEWIYGEGVLKGNEELYLERYRRHNQEVRHYFYNRPDDLLIINLAHGDGWKPLCNFLDHPIPSHYFPHANKAPDNFSRCERAYNELRNRVPLKIRRLIFYGRQSVRNVMGRPDPRDVFNNMAENRAERAKWPE